MTRLRPHIIRSGNGPAVLLIQGVGMIGEAWRPQIDGLSDAFTTVAFDNRGIGRGPAVSGPLTIESMAADALAVADAAGLDRFHVIGHSMGGVIAQELALTTPARVRSLTLMCTVGRGRDALGLTSPRMIWLGARSRLGTRRMRRDAFLEIVMPASALAGANRAALSEDLAALFGHDLADSPAIVSAQLRAMGKYDATGRLPSLRLPALVMSARHDPIAPPKHGRALAAAIPGASFMEFEDASHGLPIQHADKVNDCLRNWLHRQTA